MTDAVDLAPSPESSQRRSKITKNKTGRRRGDRVAPEGMSTKTGSRSSRKRLNGKNLKIDTSTGKRDEISIPTPGTGVSSCASIASTPSVRSKSDIRSPGQRKSPLNAQVPTPDFITQTDRYGNATTPRSEAAVDKARRDNHDDESQLEVCAETLMDTFRLMCCCLVPEDSPVSKKSVAGTVESVVVEDHPSNGLLPKIVPQDKGKQCLVLDLDETLVHSSFRAVPGADFVIPVQIEDVVHFVYVMKRPGVDEFLVEMAKHYEIVIYTASLNKYADPLLDLLDPHKTIRSRLFRESCVYYEGSYVKDLSLLDRDLSQTIIVDNSPNSYIFHPENAIDCSSFIDDPKDRELDQIGAFLKGVKDVKDIRGVAPRWREWPDMSVDEQ